MADDSLADPDALTRALPVPAARLATLDAATLAPVELAAAVRFADAAKAAHTRRAYAANWADFCRWAVPQVPAPCPAPSAAISPPWPTLVCLHDHPPGRGDRASPPRRRL